MDQEMGTTKKGTNLLVIILILLIFLIAIVFGVSILQKPKILSPLSESDSNAVRVIFVSPDASVLTSVVPLATLSATPKSSPKSTPKASSNASSSSAPR